MNPDISVAITTYNHARYIERALLSVINQKTAEINVEILIGDDGSTDGTTEIVRRYEQLYPENIRAFYHDRSQVIYVNGRPTAKHNYLNNLQHARGKYVAILDGDDYWTSEYKLHRQWQFMEQNPACSMCFHAIEVIDDTDNHIERIRPAKIKTFYELSDLIPDNFIHTSSVMFRKGLLKEFPDWFYKIAFGDWAQHLLHSLQGNIGYLNEFMSAYRLHPGGIWSTHSAKRRIKASIEVLEYFNRHSGQRYDTEIKTAIQRFEYNLVLKLLDNKNIAEARDEFRQLACRPKEQRAISIIEYLYILACTRLPIINDLFSKPLKRIRKRI